MKYLGNKKDLLIGAKKIKTFYIVTFEDEIVIFNNEESFFKTPESAKNKLIEHIYNNFINGHYWHLGRKNTFEEEKGANRNNGNINKNKEEFMKMAEKMTARLLKEKIFKVKSILY